MCDHKGDVTFNAEVYRFEDIPDFIMVDIKAKCSLCGVSFQFIGLPMGLSQDQPSSSADGTEARMPMKVYVKPEWLSDEQYNLTRN